MEDESRYMKLQEALRKDIERAFGVLQARFNVLGRESYLQSKKEVVAVSETFWILHNMLGMNQEGRFQGDAAEDGQSFNIVPELWEEEVARAQDRDLEREEQHEVAQHIADKDRHVDLEVLRTRKSVLTSSIGFHGLQEELITVAGSSRKLRGTSSSRL